MFDRIKRGLRARRLANQYEQFVREFTAECQRQNCMPKSYDPQACAFVFSRGDAGDMAFHLHNVFGEWGANDKSGKAELIARFVHSIDESCRNSTISPEKLPGELMPGIRSRAQISNLLIHNWIAGAPIDDSSATAFLPFAGDMVACVLRSLPYSKSQMAHANLSVANLSIEQAMDRAMANFRSALPSPVFEPHGEGVFCCKNLEDHQSALLLLEPGKDYPLPPIDGAPIAIAPRKELLFVTGRANRPGLVKLLDIAADAHQMPHFGSSTILQWDGHRWVLLSIDDDADLAARQQEIAQLQSGRDYGSQKQLLDRYHQSLGQDIFVPNVMFYQRTCGPGMIGLTTLGSGTTGTLLPRADRILFGKQILDPQTGLAQPKPADAVTVAWSDAIDIVGDLLEPVPYLHPPRFRALGFPQGDAWARLKAAAAR